jgi:signal transduction histidine kinase
MKLRTKTALAILTVMVIMSVVVIGSTELFKQQTIADEREGLNETASLTARQVEATVETRREDIRVYASGEIQQVNDTGSYLPAFVNQSAFFAAQTVDPDGTIRDFRGGIPADQRAAAIGKYVGNRSHVSAALNGTVAMSNPERIPGTNLTLVRIAAPIYEESAGDLQEAANPDGVLVGAIYVDFSTFFTTARTVRTSEQSVAVYDTVDGERIDLLRPESHFSNNLSARATLGIRGWDWTVEVTRDRSDLNSRLNDLRLLQGGSLLLVLVSLVGLGVWEYRTNLRQAERLLDGFGALRRGEYDHSLSLTAADEWERISDGFGALSAGLASREQAIREREQRLDVLNRVLRHNLRNEMSIVHNYADIIRDFTDDDQIEEAATTILDAEAALTSISDKARQIRAAFEDAENLARTPATELLSAAVDPVRDEYEPATITTDAPADVGLVAVPALDAAVENVVENACEHAEKPDPTVEVSVSFTPRPEDGAVASADGSPAASPTADGGQAPSEPAESPATADDLAPGATSTPETNGTAEIRVVDDGPGIPDHEYAVLQEGEETALEHGSGLGLWLVHWLVEKSRGTLAFDATDGEGTTVTITVPAVQPVPADDAAPAAPDAADDS